MKILTSKGLYVKNPIAVEAMQLCWGNWNEMCEFAGVGRLEDGKPQGCYLDKLGNALPEGETSGVLGLLIPTHNGVVIARQGDYVIKDVQGKYYPCNYEIFITTYTKVGGV